MNKLPTSLLGVILIYVNHDHVVGKLRGVCVLWKKTIDDLCFSKGNSYAKWLYLDSTKTALKKVKTYQNAKLHLYGKECFTSPICGIPSVCSIVQLHLISFTMTAADKLLTLLTVNCPNLEAIRIRQLIYTRKYLKQVSSELNANVIANTNSNAHYPFIQAIPQLKSDLISKLNYFHVDEFIIYVLFMTSAICHRLFNVELPVLPKLHTLVIPSIHWKHLECLPSLKRIIICSNRCAICFNTESFPESVALPSITDIGVELCWHCTSKPELMRKFYNMFPQLVHLDLCLISMCTYAKEKMHDCFSTAYLPSNLLSLKLKRWSLLCDEPILKSLDEKHLNPRSLSLCSKFIFCLEPLPWYSKVKHLHTQLDNPKELSRLLDLLKHFKELKNLVINCNYKFVVDMRKRHYDCWEKLKNLKIKLYIVDSIENGKNLTAEMCIEKSPEFFDYLHFSYYGF